MSRWREISDEVIISVMSENQDLKGKDLRKKIREAYPFGERANWPYKMWLKRVRIHLGIDQPKKKVFSNDNYEQFDDVNDWYKDKIGAKPIGYP